MYSTVSAISTVPDSGISKDKNVVSQARLCVSLTSILSSAAVAAAAAKLLQSCPTLCNPIDSSLPGSPCPWDSPGKNTGVGCHFLLQCTEVKSESEVAQSCLTCSDPMDCSLPGSSIHRIFQARVLEWGAIAFSVHHKEWAQMLIV